MPTPLEQVAGLFEAAASLLAVDEAEMLASLAPAETPLDEYARLIARFRSAASAAATAAPHEVRELLGRWGCCMLWLGSQRCGHGCTARGEGAAGKGRKRTEGLGFRV